MHTRKYRSLFIIHFPEVFKYIFFLCHSQNWNTYNRISGKYGCQKGILFKIKVLTQWKFQS